MGVSGGVGKTPPFQKKKKKKERSPIMCAQNAVFVFLRGHFQSQDQLRWTIEEKSIPTMDNEEQNSHTGYFLCFITLHLNNFRKQTTRRNVKRAVTVNSVITFYCNVKL